MRFRLVSMVVGAVVLAGLLASAPSFADGASSASSTTPVLDRSSPGVLGLAQQWALHEPFALPAPRVLSLAPPRLPALRMDTAGLWFDPRTLPTQRFDREEHVDHDFSMFGAPMNLRLSGYDPDGRTAPFEAHGLPLWQTDLVARLPKRFYVGVSVQQRVTGKRALVVAGTRF